MLVTEVYAEAVGDVLTSATKLLPTAVPGVPSFKATLANTILCSWIAVFVAFIGQLEKWILGTNGLPVNELREASLSELRDGLGVLTDKKLLPSAYDIWEGPRSSGLLRLRYSYSTDRLCSYSPSTLQLLPRESVEPLTLDKETHTWVRDHVTSPAPTSRAQVWRVLKRRMYHYDAGVIAYRNFPRNFLLSREQWEQVLHPLPMRDGVLPLALDIGAGDGSLNEPFRHLFSRITATELSTPLVCRLRAQGLDARFTEDPTPDVLGGDRFDVVFILNVLDRCKDPEAMLRKASSLLPPDGLLVVSVVTPPSQSDAAASAARAQRRWSVRGHDFESSAASLVDNLFVPQGWRPSRLVRAPYLCAGDSYSPVAALDACVLVLKPPLALPPAHASSANAEVECAECE